MEPLPGHAQVFGRCAHIPVCSAHRCVDEVTLKGFGGFLEINGIGVLFFLR